YNKKNHDQCKIDVKKILHLSNLNKQITRNDLRSYFIGSTKTILKPSRLLPYLNYAFIFHRTNLQEFVQNLSQLSNENEFNENWNIVVKKNTERPILFSASVKKKDIDLPLCCAG
ncbi:unnamed protein product, partial [Adineta steineri]